MLKVYISKSNDANIDDVIAIRGMLKTNPNIQVEILEHIGGKYNPNLILNANIVVVIPDLSLGKGNTVTVGEGVYKEATTTTPTFVWNGKEFKKVEHHYRIDSDNWKKAGVLKLWGCYDLKKLVAGDKDFYSKSPVVTKEKEKKKNYKYLLIKK
jgi:hypothetical protein